MQLDSRVDKVTGRHLAACLETCVGGIGESISEIIVVVDRGGADDLALVCAAVRDGREVGVGHLEKSVSRRQRRSTVTALGETDLVVALADWAAGVDG